MPTTRRALSFSASLSGTVNGEAIALKGDGNIQRGLGLTVGTYNLERLPRGFQPPLLSSILITGYPNASASVEDTPNIFRDRSYDYRRNITFRDGGDLSLRARCVLEGDHITSRFYLTGHVEVPELAGVEPLLESWEPNGPGGIRGHFTIAWRLQNGRGLVTADAESTYQIDTDEEQQGLLHRFVIMNSAVRGNTLRKTQTVGLFRELPKVLWLSGESDLQELESQLSKS